MNGNKVPVEAVTEEEFNRYVQVQKNGWFNMVMDAHQAMKVAQLEPEVYWTIVENYGELKEEFERSESE
jgi:hypothetical protein